MTDPTRRTADDVSSSSHSRQDTILGVFGWIAFALIGWVWLLAMADGLGFGANAG